MQKELIVADEKNEVWCWLIASSDQGIKRNNTFPNPQMEQLPSSYNS